jgi:hypothetical protein
MVRGTAPEDVIEYRLVIHLRFARLHEDPTCPVAAPVLPARPHLPHPHSKQRHVKYETVTGGPAAVRIAA